MKVKFVLIAAVAVFWISNVHGQPTHQKTENDVIEADQTKSNLQKREAQSDENLPYIKITDNGLKNQIICSIGNRIVSPGESHNGVVCSPELLRNVQDDSAERANKRRRQNRPNKQNGQKPNKRRKPNRRKPNRGKPNRAKPNRGKPNRGRPNRGKPNRRNPNKRNKRPLRAGLNNNDNNNNSFENIGNVLNNNDKQNARLSFQKEVNKFVRHQVKENRERMRAQQKLKKKKAQQAEEDQLNEQEEEPQADQAAPVKRKAGRRHNNGFQNQKRKNRFVKHF